MRRWIPTYLQVRPGSRLAAAALAIRLEAEDQEVENDSNSMPQLSKNLKIDKSK